MTCSADNRVGSHWYRNNRQAATRRTARTRVSLSTRTVRISRDASQSREAACERRRTSRVLRGRRKRTMLTIDRSDFAERAALIMTRCERNDRSQFYPIYVMPTRRVALPRSWNAMQRSDVEVLSVPADEMRAAESGQRSLIGHRRDVGASNGDGVELSQIGCRIDR